MDQTIVQYIFIFLLGTSFLNFAFSLLARINTKNKEFNTLVAYWPSVIFTFIIAGILRHTPTQIAFVHFFQVVSSNLYVKMLRDSLGLKTNWKKHLSIQAVAMVISAYMLTRTEAGFTASLIPLCTAFSLPFYRPIWFALVSGRHHSNWVEKTLAVFFINAVLHHFNFAFFRMVPNTEHIGWAITLAQYQCMSVFLPLLINHRREENERRNLQQALEKLSGTNIVSDQSEELYKQLELQISQKEHFYNELQKTNSHLEEERETNEMLIRTISHDLANPLTVVGAYIEMLHSDKVQPQDEEKIWSRLKVNTQSALDMIGRIRNAIITRTQASLVAINNVSIDRTMKRLLESFEPRLKEKNIKVVYKNRTSLDTLVQAEENALCEHVFANVLSNAIKFSYEGTKILITARDNGDFISVEFQDFGTGIKENRLEKGYLISTEGTNGETGTGFGLMVMGYFLRTFGASIDIKSKAEDKDHGTTVTINLKKSLTTETLKLVPQANTANIFS